MNGLDFDQWLTDMVATRPAADGLVAIDSALIADLAELLVVDERDLTLTVRCLVDVHAVASPSYEIRTGSWRIDLFPATAKAVLAGAVATAVLQHMDVAGFPVAILAAVATLLFSLHRVELRPSELILHARLLDAITGSPRDLDTLYQALPKDVRDELTMAELADMVERFHQVGLAQWDAEGITLVTAGRQRRIRLVVREPGFDQTRAAASRSAAGSADVSRKVFVIHGRDKAVVGSMFELLRALDLRPQEWEPLVAATGSTLPNLNEVVTLGLATGQAQAVVAILTPDDIVTLHPTLREINDPIDETSAVMQSRPNVFIELGMAMSAYRHRTIIVEIGRLRRVADLDGLNVIRFDGSETAIGKLVERLKLAGCAVHDTGSDWRRPERFQALEAYTRQPPAQT